MNIWQASRLEVPLCSRVHLAEESHQSGTRAAWHEMSVKVIAWLDMHLVTHWTRPSNLSTMACLGIMRLQWCSSCGNIILVQLRNSSKNVLTHMVIVALRAKHQISPAFWK